MSHGRVLIITAILALSGLPAIAQDGASFAAGVPFVSGSARDRIAELYGEREGQWALAVSDTGRWSFPWTTRGTAADARRSALERCQHTARKPCYLYATNAGVHFQTGAQPEPVDLQYGGAFDPARVPFVRQEHRDSGMQGRNDRPFAQRPSHRAIAMTRTGAWYSVDNQPSAESAAQAALARCEEREEGRRPCFLYVVNDEVVFSPDAQLF